MNAAPQPRSTSPRSRSASRSSTCRSLLLVIYSFNASRLVTVWGGFSTRWYGRSSATQRCMDAVWVTLRVAFSRPRSRPCSARWRPSRWSATGASADARSSPAWSMRRWSCPRSSSACRCCCSSSPSVSTAASGPSRWPYDAHPVLRHRGGAGAAHDLRPLAGGGRDGSRRAASADLLRRDPAADRAGDRGGLAARLHAVPGRSGDRELHFRPRRDDAADTIYSQVRLGLSPEINAISAILIGIVTLGVIAATLLSKRSLLRDRSDAH